MTTVKRYIPQMFIAAFLVIMLVMAIYSDVPVPGLINNSLVRLFMNGILVLSLVPMLRAGAGINYGLPIGILAGLLGMSIAFNFGAAGLSGFLIVLLLAAVMGLVFGYGYAQVLNRVRGREEIAGVFCGFAAVYIMSFFWAVAPFGNPEMLWPIGGQGMRPTIGLSGSLGGVLNRLGLISVGDLEIPIGGIAFFLLLCFLLQLFFKTRLGTAISAVGENPEFAHLSGLNIEQVRLTAIVMSTILGAVGICVYAQSYGFLELYESPLMMAFPAASAILLGGSAGSKTTVIQAIIGTFLFQSVYVISGPMANSLLVPELSEIMRVIITSGIILYALMYEGERGSGYEKS
ncbi:MAG: ABC transporter permease subunit [Ignavibacteriales bacterium]